jgi:hypothetical protein
MTSDGGKTWTTSWIMEWTRRDHVAEPIDRDKHHRVDDTRCEAPEARAFDEWVGEWNTFLYGGLGSGFHGQSLSIRRVLSGCGFYVAYSRLHLPPFEGAQVNINTVAGELWTFDTNESVWKSVVVWKDEELRFGIGDVMDNGIVFAYKDRKGNSVGACNVALTDGELYVGRQYLDQYIEWQLRRVE